MAPKKSIGKRPTVAKFTNKIAALALLFTVLISCQGGIPALLQHLKHPSDIAFSLQIEGGAPKWRFFVLNAELNRVIVGDVILRQLLLHPSDNYPNVYFVGTGERPVSAAIDEKSGKLYVLNAGDGNITAIDTAKIEIVKDDRGKPLSIPKNCRENKSCWLNPLQLILHRPEKNPDKLLGYVSLPKERAVAVVDLTEKSSTFATEILRIRLYTSPGKMWKSPDQRYLFVADPKKPFVHQIELANNSVRHLPVGAPSSAGAVSPDGKILYFVNPDTGGIRIFHLQKKKPLKPGDPRYPDRDEITVENSSFLSIGFLPPVPISIATADGKEKFVRGERFAWATTSTGYAYLIDSQPYKPTNIDETLPPHRLWPSAEPVPAVQNLQILLNGQPLGDPNNPFQRRYPKIKPTQKLPRGIALFPYRSKTQLWKLIYEGKIVDNIVGRFLKATPKKFVARDKVDFQKLGVQKGDLLLLHNCKDPKELLSGRGDPPDGGQPPEGDSPELPDRVPNSKLDCELEITAVEGETIAVARPPDLPEKRSWNFSIRAKGAYLVKGSVDGTLKERAVENREFKTSQFALTIASGKEPTPRDLTFQFEILDGFNPRVVRMGGTPLFIRTVPDHPTCGGKLCQLEYCREHPNCRGETCQELYTGKEDKCKGNEYCLKGKCVPLPKMWHLDPVGSRIFIVSPYRIPTFENSLR